MSDGSVGFAFPGSPIFSTSTLSAASVGSPTRSYLPSMYRITAWLQSAQTLASSSTPADSTFGRPTTEPTGVYDVPSTLCSASFDADLSGYAIATTTIWFVVSVPVLSEQIT